MHKTHVHYDTFLLLIPYITWSLIGVIIALLYYGRVSLYFSCGIQSVPAAY